MNGEDITRWRVRLDLGVAEMARFLGVPVRTLQNWEGGTRTPGCAAQSLFDVLLALEAICPVLHDMRISQARNGVSVKED